MPPRLLFVLFIFSYSDIIIEREVLMQKYIHLVQIVETEKVAANQLRTQLEDQDTEIERLKAEVPHPKKFLAFGFLLSCFSLFLQTFKVCIISLQHILLIDLGL